MRGCFIACCAGSVGGEGRIARGALSRRGWLRSATRCAGPACRPKAAFPSELGRDLRSACPRFAGADRRRGRDCARRAFPEGGGFNAAAASRPLMPQPQMTPEASFASSGVVASPAARAALAEREGFEPPLPVKVKRFSRPPHSTALPPLLCVRLANGARSYLNRIKEEALRKRGLPGGAKEIRTLDLRIANAAL